ncbi:MAG: sugar phosphate isomerase/epimerase family protein, partial [Anaerolineales bacterium]
EFDGKRPHANPMDLTPQQRREIVKEASDLGLEIAGVASNNDFASPVPEHREAQLLMVREQCRLCGELGGGVVRLFAAWPGVTVLGGVGSYEFASNGWHSFDSCTTREQRWDMVRDCLAEAAGFAQEFGVTVALQNHHPLVRHWKDMVDLVEEVDSPYLKCVLDVPMLTSQDDAFVREAALTVGNRQAISHFGGEFRRDEQGKAYCKPVNWGGEPINYPVFVKAMKDIGYTGFIDFEYCHPALNEKHQRMGIDWVETNAQLALEFMRDQIATYYK